jgi:hypothetical protein
VRSSLALIYWAFFRESPEKRASVPSVPGWDELGSCSDTVSLDMQRALELSEDGGATLTDLTAPKNDRIEHAVHGEWRFDAASKKYSVTLDAQIVIYSLVSRESIATCILVKGDLGAADLTASWFSIQEDNDPGADIDPYDRF